jgi:hypothetical protein
LTLVATPGSGMRSSLFSSLAEDFFIDLLEFEKMVKRIVSICI